MGDRDALHELPYHRGRGKSSSATGTAVNDGMVVTGISTFLNLIEANGGVTASTARISDLTQGRVVYVGPSGELVDSSDLTFDGSLVSTGVNVSGTTTTVNLNATGIATAGNIKIFIDPFIKVEHFGGTSHESKINKPMELSRNWHWMWSTFYFEKKHNGYLNALIKIFSNFFSSLFKFIFYLIIFNKDKSDIYKHRLLGIINSVLLKKSWYRPSLNNE